MATDAIVQNGAGFRVNMGDPMIVDDGYAGMDKHVLLNVAGRNSAAYDQLRWDLSGMSGFDKIYCSFDFASENFTDRDTGLNFTLTVDKPIVSNWHLNSDGDMRYYGDRNSGYATNIFQDGELNRFQLEVDMTTRLATARVNGTTVMEEYLAGYGDFTSIRTNFGQFRSTSDDEISSMHLDNFYIGNEEYVTTAPVPEPGTILLLGFGLLCFSFIKKRKEKAKITLSLP